MGMGKLTALKGAARTLGPDGPCYDSRHDCFIWLDSGLVWNPLYDPGDALRLSVVLHLNIKQQYGRVTVSRGSVRVMVRFAETRRDPLLATNLAIVLAAAQLAPQL